MSDCAKCDLVTAELGKYAAELFRLRTLLIEADALIQRYVNACNFMGQRGPAREATELSIRVQEALTE